MAEHDGDRAKRIADLQAELDELQRTAEGEVSEALSEAEDAVRETAEEANEGASDAHETVREAEEQVEQSIQEEAKDTADELGHPELAPAIADHLYERMRADGVLPTQPHHEAPVESETAETAAAETTEAPSEEAPAEVEHKEDTPPEPQHWWYRDRKIGRRR